MSYLFSCFQFFANVEFVDSLNPSDCADQSSLRDLTKTARNAYAPPSLGEFKDFFDDFTYFVQKMRFRN